MKWTIEIEKTANFWTYTLKGPEVFLGSRCWKQDDLADEIRDAVFRHINENAKEETVQLRTIEK